jgi:TP901 family phage tail tape measure protein
MSKNLDVALRLFLESRGLDAGIRRTGQNWTGTTRSMQRDALQLDKVVGGVQRTILGLGLGIGALANQRMSGQLDKDLTQIRLTASGTASQVRDLRGEIFRMARDTGRPLESLQGGFNNLIQAGAEWEQALASIRSINPASAVTGAPEDVLAGGLTVAARSYGFDLAQPGIAATLLDQMTVAGRLGNAELEDLSGIFARVGVNAKSANLAFADTLGFIEALSQIERNPERLATLADSTLRLFTNNRYKTEAAKATGVSFYNADDSARDPVDVLQDIATAYQALQSDLARDTFIADAFGQTDLDTQRGLRTLLAGNTLEQWTEMADEIRSAGGTIERDLDIALDNAIDQAARLKTVMREVGDTFAKPVNKAFADAVSFSLAPKAEGGMELSNAEVIGWGSAALVGGSVLATLMRQLPSAISGIAGRVLGDAAGTAAGVAQGKALEQVTGVQPVFITNWPAGGLGGGGAGGLGMGDVAGGIVAGEAAKKATGWLARQLPGLKGISPTNPMGAVAPALAFGGGYVAGSYLYDKIDTTAFADRLGGTIATVLARLGNDDARHALDARLDPLRDAAPPRINIAPPAGPVAAPPIINLDPLAGMSLPQPAEQSERIEYISRPAAPAPAPAIPTPRVDLAAPALPPYPALPSPLPPSVNVNAPAAPLVPAPRVDLAAPALELPRPAAASAPQVNVATPTADYAAPIVNLPPVQPAGAPLVRVDASLPMPAPAAEPALRQAQRRTEAGPPAAPLAGRVELVIDAQGRARPARIDASDRLDLQVQSGPMLPLLGG